MQGTGLEDIGIAGQAYLRDALTSCTDPLQAIEEFQVCSDLYINIFSLSDFKIESHVMTARK